MAQLSPDYALQRLTAFSREVHDYASAHPFHPLATRITFEDSGNVAIRYRLGRNQALGAFVTASILLPETDMPLGGTLFEVNSIADYFNTDNKNALKRTTLFRIGTYNANDVAEGFVATEIDRLTPSGFGYDTRSVEAVLPQPFKTIDRSSEINSEDGFDRTLLIGKRYVEWLGSNAFWFSQRQSVS